MTACVARPNAENSIDLVLIDMNRSHRHRPLSVNLAPPLSVVIVSQRFLSYICLGVTILKV